MVRRWDENRLPHGILFKSNYGVQKIMVSYIKVCGHMKDRKVI